MILNEPCCSFRPFKKVLACFMLKGRENSPQVTPLLGPALRVDTFPSPGGFSISWLTYTTPLAGTGKWGICFIFVCLFRLLSFHKKGRDFVSLIPWFLIPTGLAISSSPAGCLVLLSATISFGIRSRKRPISNKSRYESRRITTLLLWELSAPIESSLPTAASGQIL